MLPPAADAPAHDAVRAVTHRTLGLLQAWLDDARVETARLVLITGGAVATTADEDVTDLANAAVWGLVRSAQSENPDRFVLVDLDAPPAGAPELLAAARAGEPQAALRGGEL
ncbi:SpnB-like Rossmann fold domain-containing protein, partial [Streptomyces cinnamoneus]|uniref:SpnB-like Rossmann fold domain-containing protein n=1 Tax=Streptomyces cinnamoneus TaxID=53446 RepID=UPI003B9688E0